MRKLIASFFISLDGVVRQRSGGRRRCGAQSPGRTGSSSYAGD
jgi:hypothetical protein